MYMVRQLKYEHLNKLDVAQMCFIARVNNKFKNKL
jgi:hypothetical protein